MASRHEHTHNSAKKRRPKQKSQKRPSASPLTPGDWFQKLVALQKRLRAPDGCPWDREQTHATLRTYLLEEAYEVLDALQSGDERKFAEEMGDLLLQIVFHSEIATEQSRFTISDVIREVHDKMVRRHPHVFGTDSAKNSAEVLSSWEQTKLLERREQESRVSHMSKKSESLLDGVPRNVPATLEGYQLTRKAARIGFDWENVAGIFGKMSEETEELKRALAGKDSSVIEEELGDLLFAAVNLSRFLGLDPEIALRNANAKFARRFREMERVAASNGATLAKTPRPEMEELWNAVKRSEVKPARGRSKLRR